MAEQNKATEQIYTIPLRGVKNYPVWKRSNNAITLIREYLSKHMKIDVEKIKVSSELNEAVWEHGITKPPNKVRVKAVRTEDGVTAQVVGSE